MNDEYLERAEKVITDKDILINLASRRAKELASGVHPMVNVDRSQRTQYLDIALLEIAEEKISYELPEE
ncbi:MAG: DNA-directed RNA polymerase subunit omega [Lentisphaeria bacterium]|nr:DNA-directed RNA polymerase subunit omega [Lentisphaeria bacterium]